MNLLTVPQRYKNVPEKTRMCPACQSQVKRIPATSRDAIAYYQCSVCGKTYKDEWAQDNVSTAEKYSANEDTYVDNIYNPGNIFEEEPKIKTYPTQSLKGKKNEKD